MPAIEIKNLERMKKLEESAHKLFDTSKKCSQVVKNSDLIIAIFLNGSFEVVHPHEIDEILMSEYVTHVINCSQKKEFDLSENCWKDLITKEPC